MWPQKGAHCLFATIVSIWRLTDQQGKSLRDNAPKRETQNSSATVCPHRLEAGKPSPASLLHLTPPSAALSSDRTSRAGPCGQGTKGSGVPGLCGQQLPSALQLFKEVLPAGQPSPRRLPVCVSAQTSIHFPKEDLLWTCNQQSGG